MTADRLTHAQRALLVSNEPHWAGQGFGLGVGVEIDAQARAKFGPTTNGAYYWPGAFGTSFRVDPAKNLIVLYFVQCDLPPGPESIVRMVTGAGTPLQTLLELTYEALGRGAIQ
jgi:CubicO group peptidase (beta-lactamase class C family)